VVGRLDWCRGDGAVKTPYDRLKEMCDELRSGEARRRDEVTFRRRFARLLGECSADERDAILARLEAISGVSRAEAARLARVEDRIG
jgi:hypothetical protein